MTLEILSRVFENGDPIPARYTCDGDDISPPLEFRGVPETAKSLVLIVDDPDAPDPAAPLRVWTHWIVYNLPPDSAGLMEAASGRELPAGCREGLNDSREEGYGGPCPPIGRHRYFHKLYPLDRELPDLGAPDRKSIEEAMDGHVLASAELIGTYARPGS